MIILEEGALCSLGLPVSDDPKDLYLKLHVPEYLVSGPVNLGELRMQGILYEESSFWLFLLITCALGGWAAWMTGRACAQTWRPYPMFVLYLLPLAAMVRFIHYAMFEGTLLSLHYYLVDFIVLLVIGTLGFRFTKVKQMVRQYSWLYEQTSPFSYKSK